ncbi:protein of unknown function [Lentibacillus persicus]|uniref:Transcobalamin-like C-terminal domain-containing protein n=1 Tax=Lentibacillus persicus TaxID=640948 RepID=A0A1I1T1Z7_9BACI|nr:DUF4430 domain-containing protein [Lentibacillus persicus]SFD51068.1 protein of unknown function [Lentibacillus persicus]
MKKWMLYLASILMVIGFLTGCGAGSEEPTDSDESSQQTSEETNSEAELGENEVRITVSKDNGSEYIAEEEIEIEEGAKLMDVLKENFYVETAENDQFVTSIERVSAEEGEEKSWIFEVNGEMANVGASEYELSPGDEITFDFQAWE